MRRKTELIDDVALAFCNPTYERMVLSSGIADKNKFFTILSNLEEIDFLSDDNRLIFSILKTIYSRNVQDFDTSIIVIYAKDLGVYDKIGGTDYILALQKMSSTISDSNFEYALRQVIEISTKFKLYNKISLHRLEIENNVGSDSTKTASDLIGALHSSILDLSMSNKIGVEPRHIGDGLDEFIEDRKNKSISIVGLPTGYAVLDKQIDGQIAGTLFVVAARKKQGKSALLTNIALNVGIDQGVSVLYIDTEMSFQEWRTRALSAISGVDERYIKHGNYTPEAYDKLCKASEIIKKSRVFHHYLPGYNLDKITALYKKYKIKENIGLGIFDYIKEPESSSIDRQRKEYQILGDVATRLKDLAGELEIPFTSAVQLNRDGDIADSDRIARYADVTAFWAPRDEKMIKDFAIDPTRNGYFGLTIKDTRRGGTTIEPGIGFYFHKHILKIVEVSKEYQIIPLFGEESRREE